MSFIQDKIKTLNNKYKPFRNIAWFLILFIGIDFVWKLLIDEGIEGGGFSFLGYNFNWVAEPINLWTAKIVHWILNSILGYNEAILNDTVIDPQTNILRFKIVWECTGVRQMITFALIIIFYFGPIKKKLWFIPLSLFILYALNIARITGIILIAKDGFPDWFINFNEWTNNRTWVDDYETRQIFQDDWFKLFHEKLFQWIYCNGIMFLLWLWWEEKFNLPYQKQKDRKKKELPV